MRHHEPGQPAAEAVRVVELGDHASLDGREGHADQATASSRVEVKLTIGQVSRATGVAASALRYWEGLGLLPAPDRVGGQRRYPASTVDLVGLILAFRDVGFTLAELTELLAHRGDWRDLHQRKLAELDERIARARLARSAVAHGLACRHETGLFDCPKLAGLVADRLAGRSFEDSFRATHPH